MQGPPEGSGQALPHQTTKKEFFDAMSEATKKSPVKGKGDNLKRIMSENKAAQKKAGTWYAEGADPKSNKGLPKNFNTKGSKGSTTPGYESTKTAKNTASKLPKNFNVKGSSSSTTPGYSSTKIAKDQKFKKNFDARQVSKQKGKEFVKNLKTKSYPGQELNEALKKAVNKNLNPKPKKIVHKGAVNIAKNVGRKVAKFAAKRLGPVGAAITAYDVVKTIPKVTKATVKGLKGNAKSGNVNLARKL